VFCAAVFTKHLVGNLALGDLSGQLAASMTGMHKGASLTLAPLESIATQLLLSPNFMLSMSFPWCRQLLERLQQGSL